MGSVEGKIAVVTGANSGIGEGAALLLAKEGATVVLAARRLEKTKAVEEQIKAMGGTAISVAADVSIKEDCDHVIEETIKHFGRIDILVNNAGVADKHMPITKCTEEWWHEIIHIDQDSVFYMTKAAIPHMIKEQYGSIVNVSSIGGVFANAGVAYSAAKSAVNAITKNVAIQFAGKGIRCNAVCPGGTRTPLLNKDELTTFDQEFMAICADHCAHLPKAEVEDQANAILYFASDMSKAVTGQLLVVDNGATL